MRSPLELIRHKFLRDAATLQVAGLINQFSQVVSTAVLAFLLGAEGQGLFISAIALQALFYFMINTGVAQATTGQIAAAAARDNEYKSSGWIAFMAKVVLVFGVTLLVFGWFVLPPVGEKFFGSRQVGVWAAWLCAQPLLDLPRVVSTVAFQGTRRMLFLGQAENGHELVRFFLVVLGATITGSVSGAVLGQLLASAIGSILALELYREARADGGHPLPGVRQIVARMRDVKIRQGIRLGIRIGLLKNGQALFGTVFPRLIILLVANPSWVTYFHIAQRIMMVPMMFAQGVSRTMLPALGELAGLRDLDRFRRLFFRVTFITGGLISSAILVSLPLIRPVVDVLYPDDYAAPVFHFAWILALGYVPFAFAVGLEAFYIVSNRVRAWILLTVLGAIITIPTNVFLILTVPYTGTAWGLALYQSWVLVHLCYATWFLTRRARKGGVWALEHEREQDGRAGGGSPRLEASGAAE